MGRTSAEIPARRAKARGEGQKIAGEIQTHPTAQESFMKTNHNNPERQARLKRKITAGNKGGKPGQWSARKAQRLAADYKKAGGGYRKGKRTAPQKNLVQWTGEEWTTADRKRAIRSGG